MKIKAKITAIEMVNKLDFYWQTSDYLKLLEEFNYPDPEQIEPNEILDYLFMSISDFEPSDAAEIVLTYKMSTTLTTGQIQNLSHEMIIDKVAEEYSDPALHFDLFNINQLLYQAYNGTFPNTEATIIKLTFANVEDELTTITKEIVVKTLCTALKENNLIKRLYTDQISGAEPFGDVEKVIWCFKAISKNEIEIITSRYWIEKDDFNTLEIEADIFFFEDD